MARAQFIDSEFGDSLRTLYGTLFWLISFAVTAYGQNYGITATPNPIAISPGDTLGPTTITWNSPPGYSAWEVRVGSQNGALLASGTPSGQATTGNWVTDGLTFYLIAPDPSGGLLGGDLRGYSLGSVTVHLQVALTASPNPIPVQPGSSYGQTTLYWNAPGHSALQVRIGSPTGPLFAAGAPSGKATTGNWVTDGMMFYLIDPNTSATVSVFTARLGSAPTVGADADGRLEMFTLGSDGAIWRNTQMTANGAWGGWTSMGGSFTASPTVGVNSDGRLELLGRGADGAIWDASQQSPGGAWSGWTSLGGYLTSAPSLAPNADGRLEIFAIGSDNATIWHDAQGTPGGSWSGWTPISGITASLCPSVGLNANGELQLFAVSSVDAAVWTAAQQGPGGAWSGWTSLGGYLTSTPSVGTDLDGRLEIFAVGSDRATLWGDAQSAPGGGWAGWIPFSGISTSLSPSVATNSDGRLEIFEYTAEGTAWHAWQQAAGTSWTGWISLGGSLTSLPAAAVNSYGALEIVGQDVLNNISTNFQTVASGGWSGWVSQSYPIAYPIGTNPCNDITGTWSEDTAPAAKWSLTQTGSNLSGTVTSTNGGSCGNVSWSFQGQLISPGSGLFSVTAYSPSPAVDNCGIPAITSHSETVRLGGYGCSTASADWTETASSGPRSGVATWLRGSSPSGLPQVTLSGSQGVPLNGTSQFSLQISPAVLPSSSSLIVAIKTVSGAGSATFDDGSTVISNITQSRTLTIRGTSVSSTADDILIEVYSPPGVTVVAQKTITVVSVNITMQSTPNAAPASDNAVVANGTFAKRLGAALGPTLSHPLSGGTYCSIAIEYTGTVTPSNYRGMVFLRRDLLSDQDYADLSVRTVPPGPDNSGIGSLDFDPQSGGSNGKVYDLDAPGITSYVENVISRTRQNFSEYAVLDKPEGPVVSSRLLTFSRSSCTGATPRFLAPDDPNRIPGDDQAGLGTQPTTLNFK